MNSGDMRHATILVGRGYEVSFRPIDPLNPQIGSQCIIEGGFGRVSGDSVEADLQSAFYAALDQLTLHVNGLPSNRQPVLSLNQQVAALTDSQLEDLAAHILTIQAERSVPIA